MTDRAAFEKWAGKRERYHTTREWDAMHRAWQAAIAHGRKQCAKVCDAISEDKWALYKGRPPYTGKENGRASDHVQGQSDGADQCADAIRRGTE